MIFQHTYETCINEIKPSFIYANVEMCCQWAPQMLTVGPEISKIAVCSQDQPSHVPSLMCGVSLKPLWNTPSFIFLEKS